jgi:hypothetical protein
VPNLQAIHRISIDNYFEKNRHCAFNLDDLSDFITAQRAGWGLPKSWSIRHICRLLIDGGWLRAISLTSDLYTSKTRFASRLASRFQIALSIKRGSYLSHGTAASLHSLIEPAAGITYVNKEQSPKNSPRHLSQDAIDRAFLRSPRESNYRFWQMDQPNPVQYVILNGKSSHDFGVEWREDTKYGRLRVSNLERTLVDIVVRPHYSGGSSSLLNAYVKAKANADPNRIADTLERMDYAYPYHQSIGFLMARAGFRRSEYELFRKPELKYDFYLMHGMAKPLFDPEWKLYYPQSF